MARPLPWGSCESSGERVGSDESSLGTVLGAKRLSGEKLMGEGELR